MVATINPERRRIMKYNLADRQQKKEAFSYFMTLANKKAIVEVKKVHPRRTLNQNSYLHLILGAFGMYFGYTMDEAKTFYKRDINPSIYVYTKNNARFLRSSADLDKEEMAKSIDRLLQFSAENGHPLPKADDHAWIMELQNQVERVDHFL
jgi:hypothetical protein